MRQRITPMLMFVGKVCGKTEEAVNFYTSVFKNSPAGAKATADTKANVLARYGKGEEPDKEGHGKVRCIHVARPGIGGYGLRAGAPICFQRSDIVHGAL